MAVIPLTPGQAGRGQTYPWFGTASQPNSLTMTNGATLTVRDVAGDKVTVSPTSINIASSTGAGGIVPVVPPTGASGQIQIQSGSSVVTPNGSGDFNFIYPVQFTNACDTFLTTNGDFANNNFQIVSVISLANPALAALHAFTSTTGAAITTVIRFNWIAIGH